MRTLRRDNRSGFIFPEWDELIMDLAHSYGSSSGLDADLVRRHFKAINQLFPLVRDGITTNPAAVVMSTIGKAAGVYQGEVPLKSIIALAKRAKFAPNEFFAVYDSMEKRFIYVDESVESVLGYRAEDFTLEALIGASSGHNFCIAEDSPHKIRWAGIAYLIMSLPGLSFKSMKEQYAISFRINTSTSSREDLSKAGQVVMTKRSFFFTDEKSAREGLPRYHINRFSIHDISQHTYIKPVFESDFNQSYYMNLLSVLCNGAMIGLDPKFIAILDEKAKQERNKAVAWAMNGEIRKHSKIKKEISESHVADCFMKTIKPNIEYAANAWLKPTSPIIIESDSDAIEYGRKMGLIPLPDGIREMIYKSVRLR